MCNEKLAEIKKRERETLQWHKDLVEQRKREELLRQTREQEKDVELLEQAHQEYVIYFYL